MSKERKSAPGGETAESAPEGETAEERCWHVGGMPARLLGCRIKVGNRKERLGSLHHGADHQGVDEGEVNRRGVGAFGADVDSRACGCIEASCGCQHENGVCCCAP